MYTKVNCTVSHVNRWAFLIPYFLLESTMVDLAREGIRGKRSDPCLITCATLHSSTQKPENCVYLFIKWIYSEALLVSNTILVFIAYSYRRVNKLALNLKVVWNNIQSYLYTICFLSTNTCSHENMQSHSRTIHQNHYVLWNDTGSEDKLKQMVLKLWGFSNQFKKVNVSSILLQMIYQLNNQRKALYFQCYFMCVRMCVHIQKSK